MKQKQTTPMSYIWQLTILSMMAINSYKHNQEEASIWSVCRMSIFLWSVKSNFRFIKLTRTSGQSVQYRKVTKNLYSSYLFYLLIFIFEIKHVVLGKILLSTYCVSFKHLNHFNFFALMRTVYKSRKYNSSNHHNYHQVQQTAHTTEQYYHTTQLKSFFSSTKWSWCWWHNRESSSLCYYNQLYWKKKLHDNLKYWTS